MASDQIRLGCFRLERPKCKKQSSLESAGKEPTNQCRRHKEMWVHFLGREDPLEEGMATHPSTLAWRTPWTEESGRLQSMGLQKS